MRCGVAAALLPLAAVAACGGDDAPSTLPGGSDAAAGGTTPAPAATSASAGQQVLAAYLRYWDAVIAAHAKADPRSAGLATVAADPELSKVRAAVDRNRIQQISLRGTVAHTPGAIRTAGTGATVEDCYDISGWNPVNTKTGAPIDVTEEGGTGRYRVRYTLRRSGAGWLVVTDAPLGGC